jgi:ABC-type uncharacterized transport system substrate-binding protein
MLRLTSLLALAALMFAGEAAAHPHVYVTMKSEVVYAPDGTATGIRHKWTFDEMFSTYAAQGIEAKEKGKFTREELAPLAEVNITSMKDFDFFTYATADGKKIEFNNPTDYWLDFDGTALTLNFTLPLKEPVKAKAVQFEIYDGSYFVDFQFAAGADPVALAGAPAACKVAFARPGDNNIQQKRLGEAFFDKLTPSSNFGSQFANKIAVTCP